VNVIAAKPPMSPEIVPEKLVISRVLVPLSVADGGVTQP
jgi:hypothetical protein